MDPPLHTTNRQWQDKRVLEWGSRRVGHGADFSLPLAVGFERGYALPIKCFDFLVKMVHCWCILRTVFTARRYATYIHSAVYARVWCLSVCHKVTRRCFISTAKCIITQSIENWGGHSAITSLDPWPVSIAMWQYRGYTTILSLVLLQTPPPSVADALSVPLSERLSRCSRCLAAAILSEIEPATCWLRLRAQLRYHYTVTQRKKPAMFKWCSSGARGAYAFLFIRPCCTY